MSELQHDLNYLAEFLQQCDVSDLNRRETAQLARISRRLQLLPSAENVKFNNNLTFGERLADKVAELGGSWGFICIFCGFLVAWSILNSLILGSKAFDPYPYIFLNLMLSMLAAIQAPIIMMSQNRQAARDRATVLYDLNVNMKAEKAIASLNKNLDYLTQSTLKELYIVQTKLDRVVTAEQPAPTSPPATLNSNNTQ